MRDDLESRLETRLAALERRLDLLEARTKKAPAAEAAGEALGAVTGEVVRIELGGLRSGSPAETAMLRSASSSEAGRTVPPADGSRLGRSLSIAAWLLATLVLALLLRMLAEHRWIDRGLATALGFGYCLALVGIGAAFRERNRPASLTLATAGALLAQLIAVESYHRYGCLSAPAAWGALAVIAVGAASLGLRAGSRALVICGFGLTALAAAALDLQRAALLGPGIWLGATQVAAVILGRRRGWGWVRWPAHLAAAALALGWAAMSRAAGADAERLAGLAPFLLLHAAVSVAAPAWRMASGGMLRGYERFAPTAGLAAALGGALLAFGPGTAAPFGAAAALLGLGATAWSVRRDERWPGVAAAWAFATAVMVVWWLPQAGVPAPLRAAWPAAFGLLLFGAGRRLRAVRLMADALQFLGVVRLFAAGVFVGSAGGAGAAALAAAASFGQFAWGRRRAVAGAGVLARWDPAERTAALVVAAGAAASFGLLRALGVLWLGLGRPESAAYQSLAWGTILLVLLAAGVLRRWPEAIGTALFGWLMLAMKVVLWDLFVLSAGLSMLSVGTLAATAAAAAAALRSRRGVRAGIP